MATASNIERRLDQITQELEQMRRAQRSQRLPRAETNLVKIKDADVAALSIVVSGDPPTESATAGSGTAVPHYIDSTGKLQPHKDAAGEERTVDVWNASPEPAVAGGFYQTARMPDGKRLITQGGGGRYRFVLTSDMSSGTGTADIYELDGGALVESGATIKRGMWPFKALRSGDEGWCWKHGAAYFIGNAGCPGSGAES